MLGEFCIRFDRGFSRALVIEFGKINVSINSLTPGLIHAQVHLSHSGLPDLRQFRPELVDMNFAPVMPHVQSASISTRLMMPLLVQPRLSNQSLRLTQTLHRSGRLHARGLRILPILPIT